MPSTISAIDEFAAEQAVEKWWSPPGIDLTAFAAEQAVEKFRAGS